jgi:large subunit ribosomal protein L23
MDANKVDVKRAVQQLYRVDVESVRILIVPRKRKRVGRSVGFRSKWKKAIVRLAEGQSIDFFAAG